MTAHHPHPGLRTNPNSPAAIAHSMADKHHHDARLIAFLAVLPDPQEQAYHLTSREIVALRTAWRTRDGFRAAETYRAELFREGLCDRAGFLTNYGVAVRRCVKREDG